MVLVRPTAPDRRDSVVEHDRPIVSVGRSVGAEPAAAFSTPSVGE